MPTCRFACVPLVLALGMGSALAAPPPLAPHRAIYDVTLEPPGEGAKGGQVRAAEGRIVYEFTGSACKGYAFSFRQVTQLDDGEGRQRLMDHRSSSFEAGSGASFRFQSQALANGAPSNRAAGQAQRASDGSIALSVREPNVQKLDIDGATIFPVEHTRRLIEAAKAGTRTVQASVFDGSNQGSTVYETTAIIGAPLDPARSEPVLQAGEMAQVARWPVSISYFEERVGDRVPAYTLKFVMLENGVSSDIVFAFPDFSLRARMARYEPLSAEACP